MFINNFDPVAINFFSLEIRWYSLAYIFGILAGWVLAKRFFINNQGIKIKFDDYVTYIIFGILYIKNEKLISSIQKFCNVALALL